MGPQIDWDLAIGSPFVLHNMHYSIVSYVMFWNSGTYIDSSELNSSHINEEYC